MASRRLPAVRSPVRSLLRRPVSGLIAADGDWYDGIRAVLQPLAAEATIFVDLVTGLSAVTLVSGDASAVENIGLGGDFAQATPGNRPTYDPDCFSTGRGGLLANGADYMTAADYAIANQTARTVLALVKGPTTPSANQRFFANGQASGATYSTLLGATSTGLPNALTSIDGTVLGAARDVATFSGSAIDDTAHVLAMEWKASTRIRLWVDGAEDATPSRAGAAIATVYDSASGFGLMAETDGVAPLQAGAAVGILIALPRVLSAGEMAAAQAALLAAGGLA